MENLISIAALTSAAVFTPGPNNVIIMARAARGGLAAALGAIAAIVTAGAAMLVVADRLLDLYDPHLVARTATAAGASLLAVMAIAGWRHAGRSERQPLTERAVATVALFQLVNPKSWLLVATVAAAARTQGIGTPVLVPVVAAISVAGLLAWGVAGAGLTHWLAVPARLRIFDRAMAIILLGTAVTLILSLGANA